MLRGARKAREISHFDRDFFFYLHITAFASGFLAAGHKERNSRPVRLRPTPFIKDGGKRCTGDK